MSRRWWPFGQRDGNSATSKHKNPDGWKPSEPGYYMGNAVIVAVAGIVVLAIYGWASDDADGWEVTALAFLIGAASFWLAGMLGYLFGIPISLQQRSGPFKANTSLEQISDWLTKIVIGVGLVEIRALGGWLVDIGDDVASATRLAGARQLFIALILLEAACGFIFFYIWARVHMPKLFLMAERKAEQEARTRDEEASARVAAERARMQAQEADALTPERQLDLGEASD